MIFAAPHLILPPERPAIVRASDLKGLPSWQEMQRLKESTFPFPFVPRGPTLGNDSYTKILLHMEGTNGGTTFTDNNVGGSAHTWTPTNVTTSTTSPKFGATAGAFATGRIEAPDSADFTLGSSDFTVDFWLKMNGSTDGGTYRIFGQGDSAATSSTISASGTRLSGNTIGLFLNGSGTSAGPVSTTTFLAADAFRHLALVRTGNVLKMFVNGTQEGGDQAFTGAANDSANKFAVGRLGELASGDLVGTIDEFRLSVGIARWTSNFTPPTQAYL